MPELPNIVTRKLAERELHPGASHPGADLLTAFVERALTERECTAVLTHLAGCADCREVVALTQPPATTTVAVILPKPSRSLFLLRWGALAACAVLAISAAVLHKRQPAETALLAKNQIPVPVSAQPMSEQKSGPAADSKAAFGSANESETSTGEANKGNADMPPATAAPLAKGQETQALSAIARRYDAKTVLGIESKPRRETESRSRAPVRLKDNASFVGKDSMFGGSLVSNRSFGAKSVHNNADGQVGGLQATPEPAVVSPAMGISAGAALASVPASASGDSAATSAGVALQKEQALSKAKAATQPQASETVEVDATAANTTTAYAPTDKDEFRASSAQMANLPDLATARQAGSWQITPEGKLERSLDGGKSWESVAVDPNGRLRVVTATGFQVWAGGNGGVLLHSRDAGDHFSSVKVHQKSFALKGDIVTLTFPDAQHGRLETADHDVWTTNDGGKTWQLSTAK